MDVWADAGDRAIATAVELIGKATNKKTGKADPEGRVTSG